LPGLLHEELLAAFLRYGSWSALTAIGLGYALALIGSHAPTWNLAVPPNMRIVSVGDLLFNKRDYAAGEKYWSPHDIPHSAHIAPGREGLFDVIKNVPPTVKYDNAFPKRP
jgi:hypothetical protein